VKAAPKKPSVYASREPIRWMRSPVALQAWKSARMLQFAFVDQQRTAMDNEASTRAGSDAKSCIHAWSSGPPGMPRLPRNITDQNSLTRWWVSDRGHVRLSWIVERT
jgi:hypothetical protein